MADRWLDKVNAAVEAYRLAVIASRCTGWERDKMYTASGYTSSRAARAALLDIVTRGRCPECGCMVLRRTPYHDGDNWRCQGCDWTDEDTP